jgi:hypothetical protein
VLWLAPRLEAAGYAVFADILTLNPGERWRKEVTRALQEKSVKMLLCCRDETLSKNGVQEEIGIAEELVKDLGDSPFIIPLRISPFRKLFGIGEIQYVDFVGSWARGLSDLLDALDKQGVPKENEVVINPNWEAYKNRLSIKVERSPEALTSNWLRVVTVPDRIRYFVPLGAIDHSALSEAIRGARYPVEAYQRGFFSFMSHVEVDEEFGHLGRFKAHSEQEVSKFLNDGNESPKITSRNSKSIVLSMFRKSWESFCRDRGLYEYAFSKQIAFHVSKEQMPLGKRVVWESDGKKRNSMLRNKSRGKVWQYGVSATPHLWPFPHFRIKSRVIFAELEGVEAGSVFDDPRQQHRMRRSVCSVWRNKAWHGRLMAFMKLLSQESTHIDLPLSGLESVRVEAFPLRSLSPVTTVQSDEMDDDAEEKDVATLGNYANQEEG